MNGKHLTFLGVLALVVIGCVIAAGCTSTQSAENDPILGTWGISLTENDIGIEHATFLVDGTGTETMHYPNGQTDTYTFTWKKTGDNTYLVTYSDGSVWEVSIVDDNEPLSWKCITNKDDIIGTWPSTYVEMGWNISDVTTFNPDFTGFSVGSFVDYPDKEKLNQSFTWAKYGKHSFIMIYDDVISRWIAIYDPATKTVSYEKVDYTDEPVIGTHEYGETEYVVDGTTTCTFATNGTGTEGQISKKGINLGEYDFIWEKEGENTYSLVYPSSTVWEFWTVKYNPQTKQLDDWALDEYVWVDNYRTDGKHLLGIHRFDGTNGTAYEYDGFGTSKSYQTAWDVIGLHRFKVTYDDGDVWYATYMPANDSYEWEHVMATAA